MTDTDLEERMARLAARRAGGAAPTTSQMSVEAAGRRKGARAAATARIVATGASVGGTLGLIAAMAIGDQPPVATVVVAATEGPAQPAPVPPPPVVRIVYRPVPVAGSAPTTVQAPARTGVQAAPATRPAAPARRPAATTSRAS